METPSLAALVGEVIQLHVPFLDSGKPIDAKLLAIEKSGLWIEYIAISQTALAKAGVRIAPKTLAFFVPFSSIALVYASVDAPTLSESLLP